MTSVNTLDVGELTVGAVVKQAPHQSSNGSTYVRPVRVPGPQPMQGAIEPDAPPEAPEPKAMPLIKIVMPVVMVVAVVGMVAMMFVSGMARNPMTFMFPMMMVVSMLGMVVGGGSGKEDIGPARRDYQRHLASIRRAIVRAASDQRIAATYVHPNPTDLWQMIGLARAFERSEVDDDYLTLRVGIGAQRPATPVTPPEIPAPEKLDPVSAVALRHVIRQARVVRELPVAIDLKSFPVLAIGGVETGCSTGMRSGDTRSDNSGAGSSALEREGAVGLARAIVCQCAVFHHPDDVAIAYVGERDSWDWVKWLPHNWDVSRADSSGAWRLNGRSIAEVLGAIDEMQRKPKSVVLIVDSEVAPDDNDILVLSEFVAAAEHNRIQLADAASDSDEETCVRHVVVLAPNVGTDHVLYHAAISVGLSFTVREGRILAETSAGTEDIAATDYMGAATAEVLARGLSGLGRPQLEQSQQVDAGDSVLEELRLVPVLPRREFSERLGRERLRIPVGTRENGSSIYLDFKESAEGGMGPHGLCVGATGSGKSEFLKSTVLGLAATHSPNQLNFVLVDFKGGATFLGLDSLPHVSAVITNLADELVLVDRMQDAIRGEMTRRQELLRAAGNFPGVAEYEEARRGGRADLAPLPALLIVVDEFSELLAARPEFSELFVAVGRLGRSLHMHLLLASQRLEEGRLRGLESHLSYRIGLKTFSPAESRSVLGVPDAYHLPSIPGSGYLKSDSGEPVRFRAAYVSGPVDEVELPVLREQDASARRAVVPFTSKPQAVEQVVLQSDSSVVGSGAATSEQVAGEQVSGACMSVLESAVLSMRHMPRSAHQVWLPPLPPRISRTGLAALFTEGNSERSSVEPLDGRRLRAQIGVVDKPLLQRQEQLEVDLSETGGHVAIVGAPRSGKTTAIRTLVLGLADNVAAANLHFYLVDYGAGGLADLQQLPHVSAVAHRGELERIRRVVSYLHAEVGRREQHFRQQGWHSVETARSAGVADIVLCIDGWPAFRNEHLALAESVQALVADGLAVGIHVVLTAHRWTELRPAVRDLMGTRIELRQAEAMDSVIDRKAAALVPESPGRGLSAAGHAFLLADASPSDTADAAKAFRRRGDTGVAEAPKLQLLPRRLSFEDLSEQVVAEVEGGAQRELDTGNSAGHTARPGVPGVLIPIGLEEAGLSVVHFDRDKDRHLLVFGAAGSGRTSVLKTVVAGMSEKLKTTKYVVVDYRRGLMETVPPELLAGYAGSPAIAVPLLKELATTLASRLPNPDVTPAQLKARDWWQGPEIVLVIDDYELVTGGRMNPLLPLAELVPHAADIGLTIVIARRISGAHRSLHDQVLGAVKDQGATALLMSGAKEDGPLFGVPVSAQPAGRGNWISHGKPAHIVQVALPPEPGEPSASAEATAAPDASKAIAEDEV